MAQKNPQKNQLNKFIQFSGMAFQMGGTIYLGSILGAWLDTRFENDSEIYFKIATLLSVFIAMYVVIRQVNKIGNN